MNPSELRMMWMNQYNPERISLEDNTSYFGHPSVGLSVMDDINHSQTMDLNPMMSIVGGDFSGQVAAATAAVALGVQPTTTLIATNANDIYGLAHVGSLHQQFLQQQSNAAAVFHNNFEIIDDDENGRVDGRMSLSDNKLSTSQFTGEDPQSVYDDMDDPYDDEISGLQSKQEIINIDDFVMMNDSNSYDDTEFVSSDKDISQPSALSMVDGLDESEVVTPCSSATQKALINEMVTNQLNEQLVLSTGGAAVHGVHRSQRKTRKIEPVNRPGLVLKTPIAYKGNSDPSVIPIQKDGMAVCERCGAIGVKHTFYTKSRRFCSMSCARGELYSLVVNNKMSNDQQASTAGTFSNSNDSMESDTNKLDMNNQLSDGDPTIRASQRNLNYRFRITDQSKITQLNGIVNTDAITGKVNIGENISLINGSGNGLDGNSNDSESINSTDNTVPMVPMNSQTPKALRMYQDVLPQDEVPQIPKFERLPASCPQMEKIISVRRRIYDPTHSFDWSTCISEESFLAAPVTCFLHAPGYEVWDNIGLDMKVEVENTDCDNLEVIQPGQTPHSFWVATILNISGYKALMRYEGFDSESHDFWVNLCNAEVHSVGWCATRGKPLIPPRTIQNKYKDWKDFLVERLSGARTLPSSFYNKINDSMQSRFRLGLNLECVDKDHICQVRLATVTKIVGKRLFLRYFDSDDGFWCHEDSPIIHPVGWATTVGHNLAAPQDYLERMLAGREAMIEVHEDDATIELFKMNFTFEEYYVDNKANGFMEGMKLEAIDPLNLSSICAATVMAVLKFGYMMIRIDSYQPDVTGSDWFCYHEKSPSIFPVGFCAANKITLTPPNGYDINTFNWETYLHENNCIAANQQLFQRLIPDHGFEVGMSLECADIMDPRLVCVATVARVVGRLLRIHFDGWTDEYDQWLDCESPDIYPVGWCVLVNHKLEGPPTTTQQVAVKTTPKTKVAKKRKKKLAVPSVSLKSNTDNSSGVKSRTIALKTTPHLPKLSIKLELKPEHHNASFYEHDVNDDDNEDDYDDDSVSHRSDQSTPLPPHGSTNDVQQTTAATTTTGPAVIAITNKTPTTKTNNVSCKKSVSPAPPTVSRKVTSYIANSSVSNSKYIPRMTDLNDSSGSNALSSELQTDLQPDTWNIYDVSQFLRVNDCTAHCDTFSRNKIDGKRFMDLSKDEIITLLGMKVGPALKIYDLIQQLKCKINPSKSRLHKVNKAYL